MQLILVIVLLVVLYVVLAYNSMIKLRNKVKEAWSDIDVQLKRRYNLIPNIVETVKGYASHEDKVFTNVTEARSNAINATNVHDQGVAENMLSGALKSLFAVAENYPELKANENFMQLQNELVDTEDKIQSSRRFYNGMVRDWNTKIQQFPASIIANLFKFVAEEYFEIENEKEKENVQVSFKDEKKEEPVTASPTAEPSTPSAQETPPAKPMPEVEKSVEPEKSAPTEAPEAPKMEEKAEESAPEKPAEEAKEETPEPAPAEEKPEETPAKEKPAEEAPAEEPKAEEGEEKKEE